MISVLFALVLTLVSAPAQTYAASKTIYVSSQKQLQRALKGKKYDKIVIKTDKSRSFTIKKGDYEGKELVVNSAKAKVTNRGFFDGIYVKKAKSIIENADYNNIHISASTTVTVSRSVEGAEFSFKKSGIKVNMNVNGFVDSLSIEKSIKLKLEVKKKGSIDIVDVDAKGSVLHIKNTGSIESIDLNSESTVNISGKGEQPTVSVNVDGAEVNSGDLELDIVDNTENNTIVTDELSEKEIEDKQSKEEETEKTQTEKNKPEDKQQNDTTQNTNKDTENNKNKDKDKDKETDKNKDKEVQKQTEQNTEAAETINTTTDSSIETGNTTTGSSIETGNTTTGPSAVIEPVEMPIYLNYEYEVNTYVGCKVELYMKNYAQGYVGATDWKVLDGPENTSFEYGTDASQWGITVTGIKPGVTMYSACMEGQYRFIYVRVSERPEAKYIIEYNGLEIESPQLFKTTEGQFELRLYGVSLAEARQIFATPHLAKFGSYGYYGDVVINNDLTNSISQRGEYARIVVDTSGPYVKGSE